jgi:hypothetical protein
MIKKPPTHEQLVDALGAPHNSEKIYQLLEDFGIQWSDVKLVDKDSYTHEVNSYDEGFRLTFEDIGEFIELPNHDIGDGPFLLKKVSLWGYVKGYAPYAHLPWPTITFNSSLEEVETVLGEATQVTKGPNEPFRWQFENYKISMHWFEDTRKNRSVTYWYTPQK